MRSPITLFSDAWTLFSKHATLLLTIYLIPTILLVLYSLFVALFSAPDVDPTLRQIAIPFNLALTFVLIVVSIIAAIAIIKAVADPESTTILSAYKFGLENILSYVWLSLLTGITIMVGFFLLVVPGIIFMVWFAFVYYILVLEDIKGIEAMKASKAYVKGRWWPVFGRMASLIVLFIAIAVVVELVITLLFGEQQPLADIVEAVLNIVFVPFSITYMFLLYTDVKNEGSGAQEESLTPDAASGSGETIAPPMSTGNNV